MPILFIFQAIDSKIDFHQDAYRWPAAAYKQGAMRRTTRGVTKTPASRDSMYSRFNGNTKNSYTAGEIRDKFYHKL